MIIRSYDADLLTRVLNQYDYFMEPSNEAWLAIPQNLMYVCGDDIGLATFDYEGLYAVHWFFKSKGREAIKVCLSMLDKVFNEHGAHAVRGVTPVDNKPARFLAKYCGCDTISIEEFPDGKQYELMILSKDKFNQVKEKVLCRSE